MSTAHPADTFQADKLTLMPSPSLVVSCVVVETHVLDVPEEVDEELVQMDVEHPGEFSERLLAVMFGLRA